MSRMFASDRQGVQPVAPARGHSAAGFTLIEMLVVMSVVLILSGISVLAYRSYQHGRLAPEAARRVSAVFRMARECAIADAKETFFAVIDIQQGTLWVDRGTSGTEVFQPRYVSPVFLPDAVQIHSVTIGSDVWVAGLAYVPFFSDGRAAEAEVLLSEDSETTEGLRVKLYRSTGRTRIRS